MCTEDEKPPSVITLSSNPVGLLHFTQLCKGIQNERSKVCMDIALPIALHISFDFLTKYTVLISVGVASMIRGYVHLV